MRISLDGMTTSPQGIHCGVIIRGPKDSWVRFAVLDVPWESIPEDLVEAYWRWTDRDEIADAADEPLALDWG